MPSPVAELLATFGTTLATLGVPWYLFGAQAALLYGAARLTADVDVTVDLGNRPWSVLVDALAGAGFAIRVPDAAAFVDRTRVIPLVHESTGMPVDVVLAGPGLEELVLARARQESLDGVLVPVASPEDMVAMKVLAGRPKDLDDVLAILAARHDDFDLGTVRETLGLLERALDRSDLSSTLDALLARTKA